MKNLNKYGLVKTCKIVNDVVTIVVTKGFSSNAMKVFEFLNVCTKCYPNYPVLETCITEDDLAIVIMTKKK